MALGTAAIVAYEPTGRKVTQVQSVDAAGQAVDAVKFTDVVAVQATGTATAISFQVERSAKMGGDPHWAPVGDPLSGNPSAGMKVEGFVEPGYARWRVRVISITGGSANISMSGGQ